MQETSFDISKFLDGDSRWYVVHLVSQREWVPNSAAKDPSPLLSIRYKEVTSVSYDRDHNTTNLTASIPLHNRSSRNTSPKAGDLKWIKQVCLWRQTIINQSKTVSSLLCGCFEHLRFRTFTVGWSLLNHTLRRLFPLVISTFYFSKVKFHKS